MTARLIVSVVVATAALITASTVAAAVPPVKDKCSNIVGVQKKIPAGYKRGVKLKCVKQRQRPKCASDEIADSQGFCVPILPPSPPPAPTAWWPTDYTPWTGAGNAFASGSDHTPLVAYQPSTCRTVGGTEVPNGTVDPFGRVCWSYLFQVSVIWTSTSKTGCGSLFVRLRETAGGVIVGNTIGSSSDVPNNVPVQIRGSVSSDGHPDMKVEISSIDCYS